MVSHTTDLAVDFSRKVRNLISTDEYQSIFPTVNLAADSSLLAGGTQTQEVNTMRAVSVLLLLVVVDLLLVDDPHSEQDVINGNFGL